MYAIVPLSRMLDYSTCLHALSGGHRTFEMSAAGFKEVSQARRLEILKEIRCARRSIQDYGLNIQYIACPTQIDKCTNAK